MATRKEMHHVCPKDAARAKLVELGFRGMPECTKDVSDVLTNIDKNSDLNVRGIIEDWLIKCHYDGLYDPGTCACELGDLMPCGSEGAFSCLPGYRSPCNCNFEDDWPFRWTTKLQDGEVNHFHIGPTDKIDSEIAM